MNGSLSSIPMRETLHFLGWRGTPVEPELMRQIEALAAHVIGEIEPRIVLKRFVVDDQGALEAASFHPKGMDAAKLLASCHESVLLAATLGAQSERMLLKAQAKDPAQALLLDAVLSAAIEAVCDEQETQLREALRDEGLYLTDRFSPGYGDMPLEQTKAICAVLETEKTIGLSVAQSGIMIPRKSVTAIMGVSRMIVPRRKTDCEVCSMNKTCALRRRG